MAKHHLVIGSSAAAISAINKLSVIAPHDFITCITKENDEPYNKCLLADYMADVKEKSEIQLTIAKNPNFSFMHGLTVASIDAKQKRVYLSDKRILSYDTLFMGTGTRPFFPTFISQCNSPGIF